MADIFDMADTWNDGGTTFTAIKMDVTDTASDAASLLLDLQVGSSSQFSVSKAGVIAGKVDANTFSFNTVRVSGSIRADLSAFADDSNNVAFLLNTRNGNQGLVVGPNFPIAFSNTLSASASTMGAAADLFLRRDGAGIMAQRNGTNAQEFRAFNTDDGSGNAEFLSIGAQNVTNEFRIEAEATGTGTQRNIVLSGANRAALVADASDEASAITLVNALKAAAISHGLMAAT